MAPLNAIVLLILGWLFGLLGPIVVWKIQTQRKAASVRAAVGYELAELKYRMVLAAYALNQDHGTFDREFLNWVHTQVVSYRGITDSTRFLDSTNKLLADTDENIRKLSEIGRIPAKGKSVPYARIPYLEAQLAELHIFSAENQIRLLQVLEHAKIFNETVDEARAYFDKTFDQNLSTQNRQIVDGTLSTKYRHLAERARIIVSRINEVDG